MGAGSVAGKCLFCMCGPKGSLCCLVVSVWGVIMLALLGIFFQIQAVAFFEDIESFDLACNSTDPSPTCHCDPLHTTHCYDGQKIKNAYGEIAISCWIAAFIYVLFIIFTAIMTFVNQKRAKLSAQ